MIKIVFGPSPAKSYSRAVHLAKKTASYSFKDEEHHVLWNSQDVEFLIPLYRIIEGWKSFRVIIDGIETRHPKILTSWMMCYEQTDNCMKHGAWYPFGCKKTWHLEFYEYSPWLRLGKLEIDGTWVFNKTAILNYAEKEMSVYGLCPKQNKSWPKKFLDVFPASIHPSKDKLWTYQTKEELQRRQSYRFDLDLNEFDEEAERIITIIGVGPRGMRQAAEIMEQILALAELRE
ncbi:MAG: hypothetical protein EOM12_03825 [Verrucomicrobiae bacterium]|nr:hypothetical protein [Verrucomicrobiae bacterium]